MLHVKFDLGKSGVCSQPNGRTALELSAERSLCLNQRNTKEDKPEPNPCSSVRQDCGHSQHLSFDAVVVPDAFGSWVGRVACGDVYADREFRFLLLCNPH